MPDDARALLASLTPAGQIAVPPGQVAILRSHAEEAGADLAELDRWVLANGGRIARTKPRPARGLRAGQMTARTLPGERYYVLPAGALSEAPADAEA